MNIHTIQKTQTLGQVAHALYSADGTPAGGADEVVAALRRANPLFKESQKLPAGTVLLVPEIPGYSMEKLPNDTASLAGPVIAQLRSILGNVGNVLDGALHAEQKQETSTMKQLDRLAKERVLVSPSPAAVSRLKTVSTASTQRAADLQALRSEQRLHFARLEKDLAAFQKIHGA